MKTNNLLYFISLILLAGSIFLLVKYPESGRFTMIAGGIVLIGFLLNLMSFFKRAKNVI